MRKRTVLLLPTLLLAGCRVTAPPPSDLIAADRSALPANTVTLSEMMRELSRQPEFTEKFLATVNQGQTQSSLLTPELFDTFRKLVLGKDWGGLDRFPGWTSQRIAQSVKLVSRLADKESPATTEKVKRYLDLGPYSLETSETEDLDKPSNRPGFQSGQKQLGAGVTMTDGANPELAPLHAESARMAEVLNRLSLNGSGAQRFTVTIGGHAVTSPEELIAALQQTGHTVEVADVRYFANFGHFHFKGQDVEMPFWLDTQWMVPKKHWWQKARHLLVPVAHAEYEWRIKGPRIHADLTYYFGIDGKAEFRTNDQLNQPWVMGRDAHLYRDTEALEVTRLVGKFVKAYTVLHAKHADLPFGGYYALGVCQDSVGAIEMRLRGKSTLFPNTADTAYFHDQPDEEITRMMEAVPKDMGHPPDADRVFGSLPTTDFARITVPGLRDDVQSSYDAWQQEKFHHVNRMHLPLAILGVVLATGFLFWAKRKSA